MNDNSELDRKRKENMLGLVIITVVQALALFMLYILIKSLSLTNFTVVRMLMLAAVAICLAVDYQYYKIKLKSMSALPSMAPELCRVEDIFFIAYKDQGRTRYSPVPIIRSMNSGKLYFTYGKYAMAGFNTVASYSGNLMEQCDIIRRDKSPLRIGDEVKMYMANEIDIPVTIDRDRNTIHVGNYCGHFAHSNPAIDIEDIAQATVFKGLVNIERD